jgi:hypothetical protein
MDKLGFKGYVVAVEQKYQLRRLLTGMLVTR